MTIKQSIIKKYEELGHWEFAGKVARSLAQDLDHKESNIERRMRELENTKVLESRKVQIDGRGAWIVQYRTKQFNPLMGIPARELNLYLSR